MTILHTMPMTVTTETMAMTTLTKAMNADDDHNDVNGNNAFTDDRQRGWQW